MKRDKKLFLKRAFCAFGLFMFFSCKMEIPESVSLKLDSEFGVPLGDTEFLISDKITVEDLQEKLGSDSNDMQVYGLCENVNDKTEILKFLLKYKISEEVEIPDAVSAMLNSDGANLTQINNSLGAAITEFNGEVDTGINLKSILMSMSSEDENDPDGNKFQEIVDKIEFKDIKANAYICGEGLKDATFSGTIKAGDANDMENAQVLAEKTAGDPFKVVDEPSLNPNEDSLVLESDVNSKPKSSELDGDKLAQTINRRPEELRVEYSLTPTFNFQNADDVNAFVSSKKIDVVIFIELPLSFKITDDIEIDDVLDLAGNKIEDDLFNRDGADDDTISKFSDLFEDGAMTLDYLFANSTGLSLSAKIKAKDEHGNEFVNKEVSFVDGTSLYKNGSLNLESKKSIGFTAEEIQRIFTSYPFCPQISMEIKKTDDFSIKRDSAFGTWAAFTLKTGGTYSVWKK